MTQTAAERVQALITLTQRLTDLISQECRAFEARRPQDVVLTLSETSQLANAYRHESARLKANRAVIEAAPREIRLALVRATEAFDAVLARHGRALEAAKIVTEGIVRAVADEVVSQRKTGAGYGPGANRTLAPATSITLNQSA